MDLASLAGPSNNLWNLPETDPRCHNASCMAFLVGWIEDQQAYSSERYPVYAFYTTYFYCAVLAVLILFYIKSIIQDRDAGARFRERCLAGWRWWTYRRIPGWLGRHWDVSAGQLALAAAATVFLAIITFMHGHYMRDYFRYGSPPLSVRSAVIMAALLPICIATAGKVNLISIMTGISYTRLNVWHRFLAFMIFLLSIVHLIPHFISPIRDEGLAGFKRLLLEGRRERSGIILQFSFMLMLFFALPFFRRRFYEIFKLLHIIFATSFMGLLYWHVAGEQFVPDLFWASVAVMVGNTVARIVYRNRIRTTTKDFTKGYQTTLEMLPGSMTRVSVQCPRKLRWRPGQHCYLTIPGISRLQAHPFTIASVCGSQYQNAPHEIVLLVRACRGFTRQVEELAMRTSRTWSVSSLGSWQSTADFEKQVNARSWIDGPYGDYMPCLEKQYHNVVCVAGGSGITAAIPWISHLSSKMRAAAQMAPSAYGNKTCRTRTVHLVWSVQSLTWLRWIERELSDAMRDIVIANMTDMNHAQQATDRGGAPKRTTYRLKVSIFVTRDCEERELKAAMTELYLSAGIDMYTPYATVQILPGRPHYASLLPNMMDRKRNFVLACGPTGQKIDVANAVAKMQAMVFNSQAQEVALHSETFGW